MSGVGGSAKGNVLSTLGGSLVQAAANGCYEASRAAALAGVPKTTVYWWANHGVVVPSVSPVKEKLWSFSDLMALRIVSWLRRPKQGEGSPDVTVWDSSRSGSAQPLIVPGSPMSKVRMALALLDDLGINLWNDDPEPESPILVDHAGAIFVRYGDEILNLDKQRTFLPEKYLNLTGPFRSNGRIGPDLIRPRPHLRIIPAKVSGEPHIAHSRVTTQTVAALAQREFTAERIAMMYSVDVGIVEECVDLERQLTAVAVAA